MHNTRSSFSRSIVSPCVRRALILSSLAMTLVMSLACTDGDIVELKRPDIGQLFWAIRLNAKGVTVAMNGTQQLTVTPVNSAGEIVTDISPPRFRSADPSKVSVDSNGVVTGLALTSGIAVIASMTANGLTNVDTAMVAVTAQSYKLKTFVLQPIGGAGGENLTLPINFSQPANYTAKDSSGTTVTGLSIAYRSLDPTIVNAANGSFFGVSLGTTKVIASTTSYGVTLTDTITYTTIYPTTALVYLYAEQGGKPPYFGPGLVYLGVNGVVTWTNFRPAMASVIFDNGGTNVEGGNIPMLIPGLGQSRKFLAAGTYTYKDTVTGVAGKIVVLPPLDVQE